MWPILATPFARGSYFSSQNSQILLHVLLWQIGTLFLRFLAQQIDCNHSFYPQTIKWPILATPFRVYANEYTSFLITANKILVTIAIYKLHESWSIVIVICCIIITIWVYKIGIRSLSIFAAQTIAVCTGFSTWQAGFVTTTFVRGTISFTSTVDHIQKAVWGSWFLHCDR